MRETKFKKTDIGLIPTDWCFVSLGDIGDVKMCKRIMKYQTSERGEIPFYKIGTFGKQADAFIPNVLYKSFREKYSYPKKGDILLSAAGTIGRTVIFDGEPSYFQDSNIVWIANDEQKLSNALLYHIYKSLSWVTESGTIPRIYNGIIRSIKFAIPVNKDEQRKIAKALSDIDGLIQSLTKLIEKKKNIKTATMQQLLTGKKRLEGFSEPWIETEIGSLCTVIKGEQLNRDKMNGDAIYPVYNGGISPSGYHSDYNTESGTIIISEGGNSCGYVNYVQELFWRGGHCYGLFGFNGNNDFFYQILKFREKDIMKLRAGSGLPNIQKNNLNAFIVKIPNNIIEQTAIATILSDMDAEISALEKKKVKYESIKKGMMQELLTGKIRLI